MKIRLGYVAISKVLNITSSHTITFKNYSKLEKNNQDKKLDELINKNLNSLLRILKYNLENEIYFYRMTSSLIPLSTHSEVNYNWENKYNKKFIEIGNFIKKNKMRVDFHASEFCVLNSIHENVVRSSINILKIHKTMLDKFKIDSKVVLHIGSIYPNKTEAIKRFMSVFNKLDKDIKNIIILENDDKCFTMKDTLQICEKLNIPMVLDYHHHICLNNGEQIEHYIKRIFDTWGNTNLPPKIHFSSPKNDIDYRAHNEYINVKDFIKFIKKIEFINKDFDIMLEAKGKDKALFKLIDELKNNYKFIKKSIFLVQKKGN